MSASVCAQREFTFEHGSCRHRSLRKTSNTFSVNKRRRRHKPNSSKMTAWLQEHQHWKSILSSVQRLTQEFAKTDKVIRQIRQSNTGEILASLHDGECPVARRLPAFPATLPWALPTLAFRHVIKISWEETHAWYLRVFLG